MTLITSGVEILLKYSKFSELGKSGLVIYRGIPALRISLTLENGVKRINKDFIRKKNQLRKELNIYRTLKIYNPVGVV